MGKSTLVNTLVPDADLRTQAISTALATGKHTTTFSRLFDLPEAVASDARLIDTPGFQTFGIAHLSASQLAHAMPEFAPLLGRCRFNDCTHRDEPGCAVRAAMEAGEIDGRRFQLYGRLVEETLNAPSRPRP
jgi:ribosome biogenesis GTPase